MTEVELDQEVRYYTPEIEEFHAGFMYQLVINPCLSIRRIATVATMPEIDASLKLAPETIRVQYLNHGDIMAEGWVGDPYTKQLPFDYYDVYRIKDFRLELHGLSLHNDCDVCIFGKSGILFHGIVKNRSKLKQVMEMVGVTKAMNEVSKSCSMEQILVKNPDPFEFKVDYESFVKHMRWQSFREKCMWAEYLHGFTLIQDLGDVVVFDGKTITMYDDYCCEISWVSKHYKDL